MVGLSGGQWSAGDGYCPRGPRILFISIQVLGRIGS